MENKVRISIIIFFAALLLVLFISCTKSNLNNKKEKIIGVKIYEYNGDYQLLFNKWKNNGINTVFASTSLLSDDKFKKLALEFEIGTFVILPIFFAPDELEKDPSLFAIDQYGNSAEKEWVQFVCPSEKEFVKNKVQFIQNFVREHNPTGISLDFIRHFTFWEKIYLNTDLKNLPNTCFCNKCITEFCRTENLSLPSDLNSELEIYSWIKQNHFKKWTIWKCNLITNTVKYIVHEVKKEHPEIRVNLHAVPWRQEDFNGAINSVIGQDFKSLAKYVDYISPMTYSHMVKQEPKWIHSVVNDIKNVSGAKILPSIQVSIAYLDDKFDVDEFEQCLGEALKEPSCGVVFWNWDALSSDREKLEVVKNKILNF